MGLRQTGIVAGATLKALNVPASVRALELAASARRLADLTFPFGERYVVVNLPATAVEAVENGAVVHRYAAIVGDVDHPSPQIAAHVAAINLNPTWTVPVSIIKKEIIPRMQRDPGYLAREKIRILDASGAEVDPKRIDWSTERAVNYTLRQDSGAGNSLGAIRIDMPNKLAVYMHDTPSKRLFGADYRFLSHGCVRVQGVYDLAAWLLEGTSGGPVGVWDKDSLLAEIKNGAREDIKLTRSTPVIWVYLTGWASPDGAANFRNDVYGLDAAADASASAAPLAARAALRRDRAMIASRPLQNRVDPYGALVAVERARRADGQSRRALPSPRPDARPPPLGVAAMDLVPVRVPGPPSQRLGRQLHRAVLSRRADGARRRPPAVLPLPPRRCRGVPPRLRRRRRTKRAGNGRRSPPRAARRPSRAPQRTPARRTARRRDDRAERTALRRARRGVAAVELLRLWSAGAAARGRTRTGC